MNYDHLNKVGDYWNSEIFPHISHHIGITSFDDYLKQICSLPSFQWLREFKQVKLIRLPYVVDPSEFVKTYEKHCVAYACPAKPEDGLYRIIYQLSPTLHIETALWMWFENNSVQSYLSMFICFHDNKELQRFIKSIEPMRRLGNTEEAQLKGFAGFAGALK